MIDSIDVHPADLDYALDLIDFHGYGNNVSDYYPASSVLSVISFEGLTSREVLDIIDVLIDNGIEADSSLNF